MVLPMTKIRTLEELQDKLDRELVWRKREFAVIKSLVEANSTPERASYYIRSGIALIYAHWEGFIKAAGEAYLLYIATQRLTYAQLSINLVAVAARKILSEAGVSNKAALYTNVAHFFSHRLDERCKFPEGVITTKSNLDSEVLKEITHILGIDYAAYAAKVEIIDKRLLANRNSIAHGEYCQVDKKDFDEIHEEILNLMEIFHDQVADAAINKTYKRV
jgi:hypothetical protein